MSERIHYTECPVCHSRSITKILSAKDYTVSNETFDIAECSACTLRFTQDVPGPDEIGPYYKSEHYISHTNTNKGFINRMYQWVRLRTLRRKRKLIEKATGVRKGILLDIGSGIGAFVHEMATHHWQVMGLEPDAEAKKGGKHVYDLDLEDSNDIYRLSADQFDAITLWHVLEHVHDLHGYIEQLKRLLKEKGKIFIAVPNCTAKDASIYKEYWAAWDVPRHLYHFSPESMKVLLQNHGLKIEQYKPMWYDSFYISLLSSKYKNGKAHIIPAFWNGFLSNLNAWGNVKRCSSVIYVVSK